MPICSRLVSLLALVLFAVEVPAQLTVVVPNGTATTEGNTSNAFPWGRGGAGLRHQCIYGAANFTQQGITTPITIMRLRYRTNLGAASPACNYPIGGSVTLSTSAVPYPSVTTAFATQTGPDATLVFNGPLSWPASVAQPAPSSFLIDLQLTQFFVYDPTQGDLNIDCDIPIQTFTGAVQQLDVQGSGAQSARIYRSTGYINGGPNPTANATEQNHGVVVEISYVPVGGGSVATRLRYGTGCNDQSLSFYQQFAASTFNLSNSSIMMVPTSSGYVVVPGGTQWRNPTGAPLALADNAVSAPQPLGFTFPYPGGSTTSLHVSSNGFVWMQPNANNGCCAPVTPDLLTLGTRYCALWTDLNPAAGGTVRFEVDAPSQTAFVTFSAVPETGSTNLNTFQFAFQQGGLVELRWQQCSVLAHAALVGWSPGATARDPGNTTIATGLPILLQPDTYGLVLDGSARPVTGTGVTMTTRNIPGGTPLGAVVFSLTQVNPGQSLAPLGMPGCNQYVGLDFANVFVPTGTTGTFPFTVPNNTGLAGMRFFCQSATFSAGVNALGVLASNGVAFLVGTL